ncbi:hypothetical protein J1N35_042067 [Gossypium stocksii]|uniref:Protein kinase domain-containing protein n=1 Tax=Gossypium stocksii TaxID=47602 RepID=A0A9D3UGM6_9ROSI|nr:hypothetical protein J1N35_042067 [Gossypium stocksii]
MEMVTAARKFSYRELRIATSNFADEGLLGEGGLGKVYLGFLSNINCSIAVKRITPNSHQGVKEYESEPCLLTRDTQYKIAVGVASALFYLQDEWNQCVLHRDIKSSNVLLDLSFNAKLGDLGFARVVDHGQGSQTTKVMLGTDGYIAPECLDTYKAIKESDDRPEIQNKTGGMGLGTIWERVFLMLQTQDCLAITSWNKWNGLVGLACAYPNYFDRPSITQAVDIFSFKAALLMLPPGMPVPA